jgi:hypothetical protein
MRTKNMTTLHLRKSIGRSPLQLGLPRVQRIWIIRSFLLIPLLLASFALWPTPNAFGVSPAPDGGYTGNNTAEGTNALFSNTTGYNNTASGSEALSENTTGYNNTANGASALYFNTTGYYNTANGFEALYYNTSGRHNTATGVSALENNTTINGVSGNYNTANGFEALFSNTTGHRNTANGANALYFNTTGYYNTANGVNALYFNTTGAGNTAEGFQALYHNTGLNNIGLGSNAGFNLTTGSGNVCIGYGVLGVATESNTTRIKNVHSSVASARAVYVNADNKIGTLVSSRRFKDEIKPMDKASETILALKPVTFRYKKEIEPNGAIMFGLIAEEVEKVDPDLVTRNDKGEVETVRYDAVNAMLLNEFLKEHRTVQELRSTAAKQEATIAELKKDLRATVAELTARLEEEDSKIDKVSAQLETNKPAPQMVLNNQ